MHWHAPRAVRLHYMKLALSSRLRDICITHCWEHRARPPAALENELSTRMSIQAKIKALDFEIPVHASNQNSLLWSYRLICLGHLILSWQTNDVGVLWRKFTPLYYYTQRYHLCGFTSSLGCKIRSNAHNYETKRKQNGVFRPSTGEVHDHYLQCTFEGGIFLGKEVLRHRR